MSDTPVKKDEVLDKQKTEVPGKKEAAKGTKEVQIHNGNINVVQTQIMSEFNLNFARFVRLVEIWVKENPPKPKKKEKSDG